MRRLLSRLLILAAPSVRLGLRGPVATQISVPDQRGEASGTGSGGHPAGEGVGALVRWLTRRTVR